jgi:hypothetical protein
MTAHGSLDPINKKSSSSSLSSFLVFVGRGYIHSCHALSRIPVSKDVNGEQFVLRDAITTRAQQKHWSSG